MACVDRAGERDELGGAAGAGGRPARRRPRLRDDPLRGARGHGGDRRRAPEAAAGEHPRLRRVRPQRLPRLGRRQRRAGGGREGWRRRAATSPARCRPGSGAWSSARRRSSPRPAHYRLEIDAAHHRDVARRNRSARRISPPRSGTKRAGTQAICTCTRGRAVTRAPPWTRWPPSRAAAASISWSTPSTTPSRSSTSSRRCRRGTPICCCCPAWSSPPTRATPTASARPGTSITGSAIGEVTLDTALANFATQDVVFSLNHPLLDLGQTCIGCAWKHQHSAQPARRGGDRHRWLRQDRAPLRQADHRLVGAALGAGPAPRAGGRQRRSLRRHRHGHVRQPHRQPDHDGLRAPLSTRRRSSTASARGTRW